MVSHALDRGFAMPSTTQDILAPHAVARITENLSSTIQGPFYVVNEHHDGIASQITEQLELTSKVKEVTSKVNFALRYLKTIVALCYKPLEVARIVSSGDFDNYINPVHFFCTGLTLLFLSLSISKGEAGSGGIFKEGFTGPLLILFVIIPACFCGHLCLLGNGRKLRHLVYLQCYSNGIFVLLCAIVAGVGGIAQQTGNFIDIAITIIAVPMWVGLLWFGAVNWYITKLVYNVSVFRLWIALSVNGAVFPMLFALLVVLKAYLYH